MLREDGTALTEGEAEDERAEEEEGPAEAAEDASEGERVFFVVGAFFTFDGEGAFFFASFAATFFFSSAVGGVETLATASGSIFCWGCCCCFSRGTTPRRVLRVVEASGVAGEGSGEAEAEGASAVAVVVVVVSAAAAGAASASFFFFFDAGLVTVFHSLVLDGMV